MNKKTYFVPLVEQYSLRLDAFLDSLSAPDEGIHDGGTGSDKDDPSAKTRSDGTAGDG